MPEREPWRDRLAALPVEPSQLVAGAVAAVLVVAAALSWLRSGGAAGPPPELVLPQASAPARSAVDGPPSVHGAGALVRPGLYRLAEGARVADLLAAAGGPAPDADLDQLNLAAPLQDGERVYVPRRGEPAPAVAGPAGAGPGPLDINTATAEQLETLPGVGPATAQAIVAHRRERGRFRSVDELLEVPGIGEAKLRALRPRVRT